MPLYSFADLVQPALDVFRDHLAAEVAGLDLPTDRESLSVICRAIASVAQDPHGIILASQPAPYETYAKVADAIRVMAEAFPAMVTAFQGFVDELAQDPQLQACVQDAIDTGEIPPCDVHQATRAEIVRLFADLDAEDAS